MENLQYVTPEMRSRVRLLKPPTRPLWPANENAAKADVTARARAEAALAHAGLAAPSLRFALAALADDPALLRSPGAALARLRPLAAAERAGMALQTASAPSAYGSLNARFADGIAAGLLHLACAYVGWGDWPGAAPLAAVAVGAYAEGALAAGAVPEILFVVPDAGGNDRDMRERRSGERMAAFAMIGFADLGVDMRCAVRGVSDCAALAAEDPDAMRARRFVWGRYDLFAKFAEALPAPASALGVDAAGGPV